MSKPTAKKTTRPEDVPSEMGGLRMTKHRKEVYACLVDKNDHPTAQDVFERVHKDAPNISLATVYNCLEALVNHDLIQQVNFDREPSRFCCNLHEHGHFHDEKSGVIHDVTFKKGIDLTKVLDLPEGTVITDFELTLRGEITQN